MLIQKLHGFAPGAAPAPVARSAPARSAAEAAAVGTRPLVEAKAAPVAVEPAPGYTTSRSASAPAWDATAEAWKWNAGM